MRTTISFTDHFYKDHSGPNNQASGDTGTDRTKRRILLSDEKYQGIPMDSFMRTDDFKTLKQQYVDLVNVFVQFVEVNSSKVKPPLSTQTVEAVTSNLNTFSSRIANIHGDFFAAHKSVIYGAGKECSHELADLLQSEAIPIQKRLDSVVKMSETVALCSGGVMTALQGAVTELKCSTGGVKSAAHRVKIQMVETLIEQFLKESGHSYSPGNEVHYVNAYYNELSDELGVSKRDDPFITLAQSSMTPDNIRLCREKVFLKLNPKILVKTMADSYLDQVKGAQVVNVRAPIPVDQFQDVMSRNDDVKSTTLDQEYGEVKLESYLSMDDDAATMVFSKQSTLIAKQFFEKLKDEGLVNYDDAIGLNDDDGSGVVKMLGDLYWRDIGGSCEELDGQKLTELSPTAISKKLINSGLSTTEQLTLFNSLINNVREAVERHGVTEISTTWFEDFSNLVAPLGISSADTSALVHLAASVGSADGLMSLTRAGAEMDLLNSRNNNPLMTAVENGHVSVVDFLINYGVNVNSGLRNIDGDNVFMLASRCQNVQILRRLLGVPERANVDRPGLMRSLTRGVERLQKQLVGSGRWAAQVNARCSNGNTPLHEAARSGRVDNLNVLIWAGAKVSAKNGEQERKTPLLLAAENGHSDAVTALLSRGAHLGEKTRDGLTALMLAAREGHVPVVEVLLQSLADINAFDRLGFTALFYAVESSVVGAVNVLLDHGANIEIRGPSGAATPLMHAAGRGHANIVAVLLERGADLEATDSVGSTALMHAATNGKSAAISVLLQSGARIDEVDRRGASALMRAAACGHPDAIELLIGNGASVEAKDRSGATPLMHAVNSKQVNVVEVFLDKGADVEALDNRRSNALIRATMAGSAEIVSLLLRRNANADVVSGEGFTSLMCAAKQNQFGCLQALVENNASVNAVDQNGCTALMFAVREIGTAEMVEYLLDKGADMNARDNDGLTALTYAQQRGDAAILSALQARAQPVAAQMS